MPDDNEVYDPNTKTWYRITDDTSWKSVNTGATDESETNTVGDEDESEGTEPVSGFDVPNCASIGKRHKFKDRATGNISNTCLVCGAERPKPGQSVRQPSSGGSRKTSNTLDSLCGLAWNVVGFVVKSVIPEPAGPAAGKMMQLESVVAGPTLHKALKRTPLYPYIAIATGQLGWAFDLGKLLAPPLMVGALAFQPKLAENPAMRAALVGMLAPTIAEIIAKQKEQAAALSLLENYDEETIAATLSVIDDLIKPEKKDEREPAVSTA